MDASGAGSLAVEWAALQRAPGIPPLPTSATPATALKQFDIKRNLPLLAAFALVIGVGMFLGIRVYMQKRDRRAQDREDEEDDDKHPRRVRDFKAFEETVPSPIPEVDEDEEEAPAAQVSSDAMLDRLQVDNIVVRE